MNKHNSNKVKIVSDAIEESGKKGKRKTAEDINDETSKKSKSESIAVGTTIEQIILTNPALKLNKKAKRAKKREKNAKNQEAKLEKSKDREKEETKQYLQTWNDNRDKWKFQKLRQIYIQEHVFDEAMLDGEIWPVALEYLSGTKGFGRDALTKQAKAVINETDQRVKDTDNTLLTNDSKYQRARELLQYLG
ncbi:uncharacterized protein C7orf50 homolog [Malaya genurostris]|uniref:uncharacterized protein C7orf50 homolog n=1 Tax=Malaya genurostris TaxID=325434 RepID=UPI0026F3A888|nr:uncharacterized protein C7orf50 homolog [Malaya genurostris]